MSVGSTELVKEREMSGYLRLWWFLVHCGAIALGIWGALQLYG